MQRDSKLERLKKEILGFFVQDTREIEYILRITRAQSKEEIQFIMEEINKIQEEMDEHENSG